MTSNSWQRVIRRTLLLLVVWFVAGPLLGILVVDRLNSIRLGDVPLGFWIAQQGSIYVFVILIFINAWLADRASRSRAGHAMDSPPNIPRAPTGHSAAAPHPHHPPEA